MDVIYHQSIVDGYIALIPFTDADKIFEQIEAVIVTDVENTMLEKLEYVHQAPGFNFLAILRLASTTLMCE